MLSQTYSTLNFGENLSCVLNNFSYYIYYYLKNIYIKQFFSLSIKIVSNIAYEWTNDVGYKHEVLRLIANILCMFPGLTDPCVITPWAKNKRVCLTNFCQKKLSAMHFFLSFSFFLFFLYF